MTALIIRLRTCRFRLLLGSLLVLIFISPLLELGGWGDLLLVIVFTMVLIAAVFAVVDSRRTRIIAIAIAGVWLVVRTAGVIGDSDALFAASQVLLVPFLFLVVYHVVRAVILAQAVSLDVVAGGVAVYLMFAIMWAVTFDVIEYAVPGSFSFAVGPGLAVWNQLLYFSLTTITTLGYGDVHPLTPLAQIWSTMEAATGVIYMAVLMARLVSLYQR